MSERLHDAYAGYQDAPPARPFVPGHTPASSQTSFHPYLEHQPLVPSSHDPYYPTQPLYTEKPREGGGKRRRIILIVGCVLVLIAAAVAVAVVVVKRHKDNDKAAGKPSDHASSNSPSDGPDAGGNSAPGGKVLLTGGDGSMVMAEDGSQFQYKNAMGGTWYWDPSNPFKGGKANSWTPSIDEPWRWGEDRIRGVNLGGWLVLEPFITPAIFEKYTAQHAVDEWTLHSAMTADKTPGGGVAVLEQHYKTFITEQDFAQIAGAGLNWVRIPLPFWAIEKYSDEPFIEKTCWQYFLKAIQWARKYGIRIQLDLHAVPGSQNGWNHSGRKLANGNWLKSPMGYANAQRTLSYIRLLAQFISQPQYSNVVQMFGIVNEPSYLGNSTFRATDVLKHFNYEAYKTVRAASGVGKGPVISIFDQYSYQVPDWSTLKFLDGADRLALEVHPYFAFGGQEAGVQPDGLIDGACKYGSVYNRTWNTYGIISAGEWSVAVNDCGKWVSQNDLSAYELKNGKGTCDEWTNYESWTPDRVAGFRKLWNAQADSYGDWFYWTWKIGPSSITNKIESPFWSYSLGLEHGWIPQDPRESTGACGASTVPRVAAAQMPWQTGTEPTAASTNGLVWPPPALIDQPDTSILPVFVPKGPIVPLPGPNFTDPVTQKAIDTGSGLANPHDSTDGIFVPVRGCSYLPGWDAFGKPVPPTCALITQGA